MGRERRSHRPVPASPCPSRFGRPFASSSAPSGRLAPSAPSRARASPARHQQNLPAVPRCRHGPPGYGPARRCGGRCRGRPHPAPPPAHPPDRAWTACPPAPRARARQVPRCNRRPPRRHRRRGLVGGPVLSGPPRPAFNVTVRDARRSGAAAGPGPAARAVPMPVPPEVGVIIEALALRRADTGEAAHRPSSVAEPVVEAMLLTRELDQVDPGDLGARQRDAQRVRGVAGVHDERRVRPFCRACRKGRRHHRRERAQEKGGSQQRRPEPHAPYPQLGAGAPLVTSARRIGKGFSRSAGMAATVAPRSGLVRT